MKTFILKVQRPIAGSPEAPALAYNKDRSIMLTLPMTGELWNLMAGSPKIYMLAKQQANGAVRLLCRVKDQNW